MKKNLLILLSILIILSVFGCVPEEPIDDESPIPSDYPQLEHYGTVFEYRLEYFSYSFDLEDKYPLGYRDNTYSNDYNYMMGSIGEFLVQFNNDNVGTYTSGISIWYDLDNDLYVCDDGLGSCRFEVVGNQDGYIWGKIDSLLYGGSEGNIDINGKFSSKYE